MKPRLLGLFCGAGGAGMGYHRAGFEVVGVDIETQPHYPFEFVQADALEYLTAHGHEFDAIHASPPCQRYSAITKAKHAEDRHPDLIEPTRRLLIETGKPYVIENVPNAPLENPLILCGTMFGLRVIRHRLFECNPAIYFSPTCGCKNVHTQIGGKHGFIGGTYQDKMQGYVTVIGATYKLSVGSWAMGIDWMTRRELSQAIPPAYTEYIGAQLMNASQVQP
jgi:DNA (cytosine-5)-methyltransferase 1